MGVLGRKHKMHVMFGCNFQRSPEPLSGFSGDCVAAGKGHEKGGKRQKEGRKRERLACREKMRSRLVC